MSIQMPVYNLIGNLLRSLLPSRRDRERNPAQGKQLRLLEGVIL